MLGSKLLAAAAFYSWDTLFERFQFGSLRGDWFAYFMGGYLRAILDGLQEMQEDLVESSWAFDWTLHYCPENDRDRQLFEVQKLPFFSAKQRAAVRETLTLLHEAVPKNDGEECLWCLSTNLATVWSKT